LSRTVALAGAATLLASAGVAGAADRPSAAHGAGSDTATYAKRSTAKPFANQIARSTFSAEPAEGTDPRGLPPRAENVDLVSKLTFTGGPGGSVAAGQIADVAVFGNTAYLMSWSEPADCSRGGFFTVDISDPANPKELNFVPALPGSYHGEGAHVIHVDNGTFTGDLLITNNEPCPNAPVDEEGNPQAAGGFDLYDVTDPANPKALVRGFGDTGGDIQFDDQGNVTDPGSLTGDAKFANSSHSSFLWEDDGHIYAVTVDNLEANDVDIFDVTDPTNPQPVGEYYFPYLAALQGVDVHGEEANGALTFHHDMVVKEIDGRQTLLSSYWDSGYQKWDIEDPANPKYLADNDFEGEDPELPGSNLSREGNAHQAEFSFDNRYFLAGDEDFNAYRAGSFSITSGQFAGQYASAEVGGATSAASLPDQTMNGPTVYVGYACDASKPVPARSSVGLRPLQAGEEAIAVIQRGPVEDPNNTEEACFPGEKAQNAIDAGYDAVLFVNHHAGTGTPEDPYCGQGDFRSAIVAVCTTHQAFHRIFNDPENTDVPVPDDDAPALGTKGEDVQATSVFDGWGYAHLYENNNGKIREVDTYAIPEAHDPRFAFGFGDLTIHEWAADPETNLAYSSYYAGGFRVVSFGADGIKEEGSFVDEGGNNFWGVEQFTDAAGNRLIAASDRDYGLYIFKYTGPGAVLAPAPGGGETPAGETPGSDEFPGKNLSPENHVVISARALRLSRTGFARIRVGCPAVAQGSCRGSVTLRSNKRRLGRRKFNLAPGKRAGVRVKFSKAARKVLRTHKSLRVQVIVSATDDSGARLSNTQRITVRPYSAKLKAKNIRR
jgi:hypothetical protein